MIIRDRIYGEIQVEDEIQRLLEIPEVYRLRYVMQSNNSYFSPTSTVPSRLEHCFGVYHLAKVLSEKREFSKDALSLKVAAFLHDLGHPPFGHASEFFLKEVMKLDHEEFSFWIINNSPIKDLLESLGVEVGRITELISGKERPLGGLFNGSIDLDNIDNIIRYGTAVGIKVNPYYDPIGITKSFTLEDKELALLKNAIPEVEKWLKVRHDLYSFIEGSPKICDLMVRRAISFAFFEGDINKEYFLMTDYDAMNYLKSSNPKSKFLIDSLNEGKLFKKVFSKNLSEETAKRLRNVTTLSEITNELAKEVNIPEKKIALHVAPYKGSRKIQLPIVGEKQVTFENEIEVKWDIVVAAASDININEGLIDGLLQKKAGDRQTSGKK